MSDQVKDIRDAVGRLLLTVDAAIARKVIDSMWVDTTKVFIETYGINHVVDTINALILNKCACDDCRSSARVEADKTKEELGLTSTGIKEPTKKDMN